MTRHIAGKDPKSTLSALRAQRQGNLILKSWTPHKTFG
jgi:hypothetical protein